MSKLDRLQQPTLGVQPAPPARPVHVPVRLDAAESPLDWPDDLKLAWSEAFQKLAWNRAPAGHLDVARALGAEVGLNPDHVALGAGLESLLTALLLAWGLPGAVVYPVPTTPLYARVAQAVGMVPIGVLLRADFSLPLDHVAAVVRQQGARVVIVGSPNDPTGALVARDEILTLATETDALVIVDETHAVTPDLSVVDMLSEAENLVVVRDAGPLLRTSAFPLAWAIGHPRVMAALAHVPLAGAIGAPTLLAAHFALGHRARLQGAATARGRTRDALRRDLDGVRGIVTWPSVADFLLVGTTLPGRDVACRLLDQGIAVWPLDTSPLMNCIRVTVGTPRENAALVAALTALFGAVT